ncbi:MAG: class I SAM-dependent methyltransferase [Lentisphaerota bacterium]
MKWFDKMLKRIAVAGYRMAQQEINQQKLHGDLKRLFPNSYEGALVGRFRTLSKTIDARLKGRYCGSLEDRLIQMMATYDAARRLTGEPTPLCHAHIGVLFGGSLIAALETLRMANSRQTVVGIDPLAGFYGKSIEPVTGLPITQETVRENIALFGFQPEQVELIASPSNDPAVLARLGNRRLATLFIDGDHSYEGVKRDWEIYSPLVAPGGYVIFDDYKMMFHYFTVTQFVMDLLHTRPDPWRVVGALDTTILLQRQADGKEFQISGSF